jgi:hypothetical protein
MVERIYDRSKLSEDAEDLLEDIEEQDKEELLDRVIAVGLVAALFRILCWGGCELGKQRKENEEWWRKWGQKYDGQK